MTLLPGMHLKKHFEPQRHKVTESLIVFLGVFVSERLGLWTFARSQINR
jgi:hypothetical protein